MSKYFKPDYIADSLRRLSAYSEKWVVVPLVFAVNDINQDYLVNPNEAGRPGTARFLKAYFSGRLIGSAFPNMRPRFSEAEKHDEADLVAYGKQALWGSSYSSRGYREMMTAGLLEIQNGTYRLNASFFEKWQEQLPAHFAFEDLLVWLFAFDGVPDSAASFGDLETAFWNQTLGAGNVPRSEYQQRFKVGLSAQAPTWPTEFLTEKPSRDEMLQTIAPSMIAAEASEPEDTREAARLTPNVLQALKTRGLEFDDVIVDTAIAALVSGKHLLLVGPPGTGKTALAQALAEGAAHSGLAGGYTTATATADWTSVDTVGGYWPTRENQLEFKAGQVLDAISGNRWLVLDEINRADADKALGQLFTVLSGQSVILPFTDERAKPYAIAAGADESMFEDSSDWAFVYFVPNDWRIIATMNSRDRDLLFDLSTALQRRFAFVEVPAPDAATARAIIRHRLDEYREDLPALALLEDSFCALAETPPHGLGPAIIIDTIHYCASRLRITGETEPEAAMGYLMEAVLALVAPQIADLARADLNQATKHLEQKVFASLENAGFIARVGRLLGVAPLRQNAIVDDVALES